MFIDLHCNFQHAVFVTHVSCLRMDMSVEQLEQRNLTFLNVCYPARAVPNSR